LDGLSEAIKQMKNLARGGEIMEWVYHPKDLMLCTMDMPEDKPHYEVDLERCTSVAQILDWIAQVNAKTWSTPEIVGKLVIELNWLLYLQKNFCSFGQNLKVDKKDIRKLIDANLNSHARLERWKKKKAAGEKKRHAGLY
jgi:hypothetical protein